MEILKKIDFYNYYLGGTNANQSNTRLDIQRLSEGCRS